MQRGNPEGHLAAARIMGKPVSSFDGLLHEVGEGEGEGDGVRALPSSLGPYQLPSG